MTTPPHTPGSDSARRSLPAAADPLEGAHTPSYQGSRFPWWLALYWIAFFIFGLVYLGRHYLPDLKAWLTR